METVTVIDYLDEFDDVPAGVPTRGFHIAEYRSTHFSASRKNAP